MLGEEGLVGPVQGRVGPIEAREGSAGKGVGDVTYGGGGGRTRLLCPPWRCWLCPPPLPSSAPARARASRLNWTEQPLDPRYASALARLESSAQSDSVHSDLGRGDEGRRGNVSRRTYKVAGKQKERDDRERAHTRTQWRGSGRSVPGPARRPRAGPKRRAGSRTPGRPRLPGS